MKTKILFLSLLLATSLRAQTVDELIQKYEAARGGAKLKALKSVVLTGAMSMGDMQAPMKITKSRPDHFRMDFKFGDATATQAFDGVTAWSTQPGTPGAVKMTGDDMVAVRDQADFDGPLVDYKRKGNTLELIGKADLDGKPAYKLKLKTKSGEETMVYLDAATYLEVRDEVKRKVDGQDIESETSISGYREVEGVRFATRVEAKLKSGDAVPAVFTIDKIELNPKFEPDVFAMPK